MGRLKIKSSFSLKVILVVLVGILLPLSVTLGLSLRNYTQSFSTTVDSISMQQVEYLAGHLSDSFSSAQNAISLWMTNNRVTSFVRSLPEADSGERMQESLTELCGISSDYRNAYLYAPAHERLYRAFHEFVNLDYAEISTSDLLSRIERVWQVYTFLYPYGTSPETLSVAVPIRSGSTSKFLGYCMLKFSASFLSDTFELASYPFGTLYCLNGQGEVVHASEKTAELPISFDAALAEQELQTVDTYRVFCRRVPNSELFILSISPSRVWSLGVSKPYIAGVALSLLIVALSIGITVLIIRSLLTPVRLLAGTMETNDPEQLTPVPVSGRRDEIGVLQRTYNDMIERINTMIETQYRSELLIRDTQLRALQLQINPHFVNNTLQMISSIALEQGMPDIYDLLQAFSRMFYYCLRFKNDVVELGDELNYLEHYFLIQKHRFPDKFVMNLEIDDADRPLPIPKMTLQPILENTFQHSFEGISRKVNVTILTVRNGGDYEVIVEDDGCGIDAETLSALQSRLEDRTPGSAAASQQVSIGLTNVNARIQLLYGSPYGLRIESTEGMGTTIIVRLPISDGKEEL